MIEYLEVHERTDGVRLCQTSIYSAWFGVHLSTAPIHICPTYPITPLRPLVLTIPSQPPLLEVSLGRHLTGQLRGLLTFEYMCLPKTRSGINRRLKGVIFIIQRGRPLELRTAGSQNLEGSNSCARVA